MRRKRLRILAMMHQDLVPPDDVSDLPQEEVDPYKTEFDVVHGLRQLGHEVVKLGLHDEIAPLRKALKQVKPHVVFNLLEEFHGETVYDQHVVSYLELDRVAYTGCNARGLVLGRDKALSKKILAYHRIRAPKFAVSPMGRKFKRPKRLEFPLIVKSLIEEGSTGISEASVVYNDEKLQERVKFIHRKFGTDAIIEQFIDGREIYAGIMGNHILTVFPPWELDLENLRPDAPRIATRKIKWDPEYWDKHKINIGPAKDMPKETLRTYPALCKRIYKLLGLSGYARLDFRMTEDGELYFLEANPNPDVARYEEFATAAEAAGFSYEDMLQKIVNLGVSARRASS
jgi:D-alanine-D-alanine ligase